VTGIETRGRVIATVATGAVVISRHALIEMERDGILFADLENTLAGSVLVEDYPDHVRGPCVLLLHASASGPMHAVWGFRAGSATPVVLVTAWRPDPARWTDDFRERRR
jgi:hypothetical protein